MQLALVVVHAADAGRTRDTEERRRTWLEELQQLLPGRRVEVRTAGGPFEDEAEGLWSQFDAGKKKLTPQKLVLETKRDGLTSIVALGRQVARMDADLVLGEGQGAVIAAGYARPALLEFALQARNVQREEVRLVVGAWSKVKGCVLLKPRLGKAGVGLKLLELALPELFDLAYPRQGPRIYGL